jgi:hypothetical protein
MAKGTKEARAQVGTIQRQYGISKKILDENPDLQAVLDKVFADLARGVEYEEADIALMLQETNWFKRHSDNWMKIQRDRASKDPRVWDAIVGNRAEQVKKTYLAAGAEIDDATARKYAEQLIYGSGWDGEEFEIYDDKWLADQLGSAIDFDKKKVVNGVEMYDLRGNAETQAENLYKMADSYGLSTSMSNRAFTSWFEKSLKGVLDGDIAEADLDDELVDQAMSRFPGLSSQLQRGMTLRDAADPYMRTISDILEVSPDSLTFDDDLVQRVLNGASTDGSFKPMSLYEARVAARRDPRWQYTSGAKNEYTNIANMILRDFGFLG